MYYKDLMWLWRRVHVSFHEIIDRKLGAKDIDAKQCK